MKTIGKMKVLKKLSALLCVGIMIFFLSCEEKDDIKNKVPQPLSNISIGNIPGGTKVFYTVPQGNDITLITAEFTTSDGVTKILSFEVINNPNSLTLTNLSTEKRVLKLYTVNSQGNSSESVEIEIEPLMNLEVKYLNNIMESVKLNSVLGGGISINFLNNEDKKDVIFNISYKNKEGKWVEHPSVINSNDKNGSIVLEQLNNLDFKLFLSDENSEISSTKEYTITPIIETKLDKSKFKNGMLPGDYGNAGGYPIEHLWNDDTTTYLTYQVEPNPLPHTFTIDLGADQNLKLTSVKMHYHCNWDVFTYDDNAPKVFEIYGSNNPDDYGYWESWSLIVKCVSVKPSGSPFGTVTDEDFEYIKAGETFKFPEPYVAYRYIRFKVIETWGVVAPEIIMSRFAEMTLFGY